MLEGTVHLTNGDQGLSLSAGSSATVRRGTPHAWCNLSDSPARMLVIFSPGDMEEAFRLIGTVDGGDLAAIAHIGEMWRLHHHRPTAFREYLLCDVAKTAAVSPDL